MQKVETFGNSADLAASVLSVAAALGMGSATESEGGVAAISAGMALFAKLVDADGRRHFRCIQDLESSIQMISAQVNRSAEDLASDISFRSAVLRVLPLLVRTERAERICLLREALVSVGTRRETSDDHIETFIRYIDELSPGHIRVLGAVRDSFARRPSIASMDHLFDDVRAQLSSMDRATFRQFFRDLETRGLIHARDVEDYSEYATREIFRTVEESRKQAPGLTEFGARFIDFISGTRTRSVSSAASTPG